MYKKPALRIIKLRTSMQQQICIEVLVLTICVWACVWGVLEESLDGIKHKGVRITIYGALMAAALYLAHAAAHVSMCSLL
tara:strand:+ start:1309 stop:1548 length:240 start_codon:yes stop_codon:yes gene_type:complete